MMRFLAIVAVAMLVTANSGQRVLAEELRQIPFGTDSSGLGHSMGTPFMVEEDAWVEYMDEQVHEQYFVQAREALAKSDKKEAARQLGFGVLYMRLEGGRASKEVKPALKQSELVLRRMADGLKSGTAPALIALDSAYARANYMLAKHHYLKARENWADRASTVVGHDLKASANELQFAITWSGQPLTETMKQTLYDIVVVGEKMADNSDYSQDDVDKTIATIGQQVDLVGKSPAFAR